MGTKWMNYCCFITCSIHNDRDAYAWTNVSSIRIVWRSDIRFLRLFRVTPQRNSWKFHEIQMSWTPLALLTNLLILIECKSWKQSDNIIRRTLEMENQSKSMMHANLCPALNMTTQHLLKSMRWWTQSQWLCVDHDRSQSTTEINWKSPDEFESHAIAQIQMRNGKKKRRVDASRYCRCLLIVLMPLHCHLNMFTFSFRCILAMARFLSTFSIDKYIEKSTGERNREWNGTFARAVYWWRMNSKFRLT